MRWEQDYFGWVSDVISWGLVIFTEKLEGFFSPIFPSGCCLSCCLASPSLWCGVRRSFWSWGWLGCGAKKKSIQFHCSAVVTKGWYQWVFWMPGSLFPAEKGRSVSPPASWCLSAVQTNNNMGWIAHCNGWSCFFEWRFGTALEHPESELRSQGLFWLTWLPCPTTSVALGEQKGSPQPHWDTSPHRPWWPLCSVCIPLAAQLSSRVQGCVSSSSMQKPQHRGHTLISSHRHWGMSVALGKTSEFPPSSL